MSDPMPRVMSLREIERGIEPEGRESRKRRLDPMQQSKPTAPSQFFPLSGCRPRIGAKKNFGCATGGGLTQLPAWYGPDRVKGK
jgi:hypothetical protein